MINCNKLFFLIGPPGVGKGYYSNWSQKRFNFTYLASGEIARALSKQPETALAKKSDQIIKKGQLLPPQFITALVLAQIKQLAPSYLILDGFPRNSLQWKYFRKEIRTEQIVFLYFSAQPSFCQKMIADRQICPQCGTIYNTKSSPSQKRGVCDYDQNVLIKRVDDQKFQARFQIFQKETQPMVQSLQKLFPTLFFEIAVDQQTSSQIEAQLFKIYTHFQVPSKN